ncbi:MAG: hypothetical protein ACRDTU_20305 [Micromonosporaceae bacterium]
MSTSVEVPGRYNGPPGTANGGYICGLLAASAPAAPGLLPSVTLLDPVPVGTPMQLSGNGSHTGLYLDERLLATVTGTRTPIPGPPPVTTTAARAASAGFLGHDGHPFPDCFVCGPRRTGDGLLLAPGAVGNGTVACTWTPAGSQGEPVASEIVWSALDCPGGWTEDPRPRPAVLTQMSAELLTPVVAGSEYAVVARRVADHGRTFVNATGLFTASGTLIAKARALWTVVAA